MASRSAPLNLSHYSLTYSLVQEDFSQFSKGKSSEAKLNNFMRLEPTFRLLGVPFNINLVSSHSIDPSLCTTAVFSH